MRRDPSDPMEAEFDTVAEWTAQVAVDLGPEYYIPAACRGSGQPAALDWLLQSLRPAPDELLLDVGAGVGGPAAYATAKTGARPVLAEPAPDACRAAARLFGLPVVQADATVLPFMSGAFRTAWCLGVLCTAAGPDEQLAMLRELRRVVRPGGRIGLLVFLAVTGKLDDPPHGNHFPTSTGLHALLRQADLDVEAVADSGDMPAPPAGWQDRTAAVERELQRRFGAAPQLATAGEQSHRIGRLLSSGQLTSQVLLLERETRFVNTTLLPGFESRRVDVDGVTINCAVAGSGSPVLMLHGYPENHLMWRHVAPAIARDHTVVLADLRGYGDSGKPAPDAAGEVYAKRSMARDQLGLMRELGFTEFQLVGHDRGARVSHRLTLDHPGAVTRLAVLDIVPTRHIYGHVTREMATAYYHWFFLPLRHGIPEHMIGADPGFWVNSIVGPLLGPGASLDPDVLADYIRCFSDPATIAGSCADYRSGASLDLVHDDETYGSGQRIECPVLVLWGTQGFVGRGYQPLAVWQDYAADVRGEALPTGHFIPEEAPGLVIAALRDFLD